MLNVIVRFVVIAATSTGFYYLFEAQTGQWFQFWLSPLALVFWVIANIGAGLGLKTSKNIGLNILVGIQLALPIFGWAVGLSALGIFLVNGIRKKSWTPYALADLNE